MEDKFGFEDIQEMLEGVGFDREYTRELKSRFPKEGITAIKEKGLGRTKK